MLFLKPAEPAGGMQWIQGAAEKAVVGLVWEATGSPAPTFSAFCAQGHYDLLPPAVPMHTVWTTQDFLPYSGLTEAVVWVPGLLPESAREGCTAVSPLLPDTGVPVCPAWAPMLTLFFNLVAFSQHLPHSPSPPTPPSLMSTLAFGERLPQMPLAQRQRRR